MTAIEKAARSPVEKLIPWLGYVEKASNSQLDSLTGNAGKNNYTFIAEYFDDLWRSGYKFYNTLKNGPYGEWCDMTVDWACCQAFGPENARKVLYQPMESAGAGCQYSANYYRSNNAWVTRATGPKVGDQIFFGAYGKESHTGIVEKVDSAKVYTIEGNSGNALMRRTYDRNYSNISGYGRPNYALVAGMFEGDTEPAPTPVPDPVKTCKVEIPVLQKGSTGGYVKTLQILLNAYANAKLGVDGVFGNVTDAAVKAYQKKHATAVDGVVGAVTWTLLLK